MGTLVTAAILAAIGGGTVLHDHLTPDGQFSFVFIALAVLAVLIWALGALCSNDDGAPSRGKDGRS